VVEQSAQRGGEWVPSWEPIEVPRRSTPAGHGPESRPEEHWDRVPDGEEGDDGALDDADGAPGPIHVPRNRFRRLRERWVPEGLRARVDPGRRGAALLSLVALGASAVALAGVWVGGGSGGAVPQVSTVATAGSTAPAASDRSTAVGTSTNRPTPGSIVVSVTGSVRRPGVVTLPATARVIDAVEAAGGFLDGTDLTGMNLAAPLHDGDSVVIAGPSPGLQGGGGSTTGGARSSSGKVNLNTADGAALETLPGVGPAMAANILGWRATNGKFTSLEQLREIPGIGPARYATLSALVTLG
jgi:competence protein ComEA